MRAWLLEGDFKEKTEEVSKVEYCDHGSHTGVEYLALIISVPVLGWIGGALAIALDCYTTVTDAHYTAFNGKELMVDPNRGGEIQVTPYLRQVCNLHCKVGYKVGIDLRYEETYRRRPSVTIDLDPEAGRGDPFDEVHTMVKEKRIKQKIKDSNPGISDAEAAVLEAEVINQFASGNANLVMGVFTPDAQPENDMRRRVAGGWEYEMQGNTSYTHAVITFSAGGSLMVSREKLVSYRKNDGFDTWQRLCRLYLEDQIY